MAQSLSTRPGKTVVVTTGPLAGLEGLVSMVSTRHGGQRIQEIGDGVLRSFTTHDPRTTNNDPRTTSNEQHRPK